MIYKYNQTDISVSTQEFSLGKCTTLILSNKEPTKRYFFQKKV